MESVVPLSRYAVGGMGYQKAWYTVKANKTMCENQSVLACDLFLGVFEK